MKIIEINSTEFSYGTRYYIGYKKPTTYGEYEYLYVHKDKTSHPSCGVENFWETKKQAMDFVKSLGVKKKMVYVLEN